MIRTLALATTALLLAAGCSASVTVGPDSSDSAAPAAPAESAASAPAESPAGSAEAAPPTLGPGFTLVSSDMGSPGANGFSAVAGGTDVVAGATYTYTEDDMDVGLAVSRDGGMTWSTSGSVPLPGRQYIDALMVTVDGVVLVGSTTRDKGDTTVNEPLFLAAPAPDFVPQVVPTPDGFRGDVDFVAVFEDGDDWVIVGVTEKPERDGTDDNDDIPTVWRSPDQGATWTRTEVPVPGSPDTPLNAFAFGPDGSWNLVGSADQDSRRGDRQYDAAWLRSTDSGSSFELMDPDSFAGTVDQGSYRLAISPSGAIAIVGWDELVDGGEEISALWAAPAGGPVQRIGQPEVPIEGGTPPGEFLTGVLWDNETLVAWGSPTGEFPMPEVQFWAFDGTGFVPTTTLSGDGDLIVLQRVLTNGDTALLFGTTGDAEQRNLAVWAGMLGQQ